MNTKIGDEFVEMLDYGRGYGQTMKVAKIHKNGNIVFEGSPQQYRGWGDDSVHATGAGYRGKSYRRVTPDLVAKIKRSREVDAARKKLREKGEYLINLARTASDDDALANAAELP